MKIHVSGDIEPRNPHADEASIGLSHLASSAAQSQTTRLRRKFITRHSLLAVINDILDFSKIEAGKLEIETLNSSSMKSLAAVTTLPCAEGAPKGLGFPRPRRSRLPEVLLGDPLPPRQILTNLRQQRRQFHRARRIRLEIEASRNEPAKRFNSSSPCATRHRHDQGASGEIVPAVHVRPTFPPPASTAHGPRPHHLPPAG